MVVSYIRVSTNKQDLESQELEILKYCSDNKIFIDKTLKVEISTRKSQEARKIKELKNLLQDGDLLITTELSRLGRSMVEVINLVLELTNKGVQILFLRQKELSNFDGGVLSKLILAIYAYLAESEREFISLRTKAGLEKAKAKGKKLGRRFGTQNSSFDKDIDKIKMLLEQGLTIRSIWKLLYQNPENSKHYQSLLWFLNDRKLRNPKARKKNK